MCTELNGRRLWNQTACLVPTMTVAAAACPTAPIIGQAIELSRTPWSVRSATPEPGEHTDAVLSELGYGAGDIETLRAKKVV